MIGMLNLRWNLYPIQMCLSFWAVWTYKRQIMKSVKDIPTFLNLQSPWVWPETVINYWTPSSSRNIKLLTVKLENPLTSLIRAIVFSKCYYPFEQASINRVEAGFCGFSFFHPLSSLHQDWKCKRCVDPAGPINNSSTKRKREKPVTMLLVCAYVIVIHALCV